MNSSLASFIGTKFTINSSKPATDSSSISFAATIFSSPDTIKLSIRESESSGQQLLENLHQKTFGRRKVILYIY